MTNTQRVKILKNKIGVCYGYDKEFGICLIYGCTCPATKDVECYHENKEGLKQFLK